ncbi:MAG: MFS transporter [Aquabacterium sp.]|nr:MFS transporter [Aquabacterium sp.]
MAHLTRSAAPKLPPGLLRVMLGTTLVVLSYSLLNPVLAVRLQTGGASSTAIGLFAMLPFISVAGLVPLVPQLFARVGVGHAYRAGLLLELVSCLGYLVTDDYRIWCGLGLMAGVGAAAAWNATEALIAHNVPPSHRGRLTGLYQALLGAGMALGPMLPGLLRIGPMEANAIAAGGLALGLLITLAPAVTQLKAMHDDHEPMSLLSAWRFRPALAWAAVVGGVFEVGLGSITTAYGSQIGMNLAAATSIAGALGMGSFLLVCAAAWGGIGGALYTLSMIRVAHDFADTSALAGTSAMIAGYTAGGALGPLVSGWVFDHFGAGGQGCWLAVLALSLLLMQTKPTQAAPRATD